MALTKEDLQAIAELTRTIVKEELEPIKTDIDQIKEDTAITREAVNALGEWVEVASDVLKIGYPLQKAE